MKILIGAIDPMPPLRLSEEYDAAGANVAAVVEGLKGSNRRHMAPDDPKPLKLLLRGEAGEVRGGLPGATRWDWPMIHALWAEYEGRGHGRALLGRAQAIATGRGCRRAALDTTDFQARGFYERAFGELVDYPPGSRAISMEKTLVAPAMG